jgi:hypothetical protein
MVKSLIHRGRVGGSRCSLRCASRTCDESHPLLAEMCFALQPTVHLGVTAHTVCAAQSLDVVGHGRSSPRIFSLRDADAAR